MKGMIKSIIVGKKCLNREGFQRKHQFFPSARLAFKSFLESLNVASNEYVLLPAYIGWSKNEGSGVFDPIAELNLKHEFYGLDGKLKIDLEDLEQKFRCLPVKVFVLIHYFGFVDPGYEKAVSLARKHGAWIVEDEAHALFTDVIGGRCGRLGQVSIFSLHKMLPMERGGMILANTGNEHLLDKIKGSCIKREWESLWEYDLWAIARRRRKNACLCAELIGPYRDELEMLYDEIPEGVYPQTFPLLIKRANRDELYTLLNDAGFGVVSLYHTLISDIGQERFPASHDVSRKIVNLPIHQDASEKDIERLVTVLLKLAGIAS